jgi:mRNA interferase MazF
MIEEAQVVLFRFPQTDLQKGKLRPALVLRKLPGRYNDWLICMISSQVEHEIPDFDEVIAPCDVDFSDSGLKVLSLIRISRVAVVDGSILLGKTGQISNERLKRIKHNLSRWIFPD